MKIVYPICCGVDVHKNFLVGTIISTLSGSLEPHYQKRRFSTFNSDLNRFADWLHTNSCLDVCRESTGKYWVPVFNILTAVFALLTTGEVWNPVDLFRIDLPDSLKEKQLTEAISQATRFLEKQGLVVS